MTTSTLLEPDRTDANLGLLQRLSAWIWFNKDSGEGRIRQLLRMVLRIALIVYAEFSRDRIPLRASALTFVVVLSMVPMLALGTSVLKGLGAGGQMRQAAYVLIEQQMGSPAMPAAGDDLSRSAAGETTARDEQRGAPGDAASDQQLSLVMHLKKAVDLVFDYVDKTNFAALGALGIMALVLSVLSLLSCVETAMNDIWQASNCRSPGRKLIDYLALMILLPLSINIGIGAMATLQSPALLNWLQTKIPITGHLLLNMLPLLAVVITFTLLYAFLPNTRVHAIPALIGGFFGGLFLLLVQAIYIKLQFAVARYNAIYGSFATLPLFLLWLYIGWMVFLGGAEVSFACQSWRRYQWQRKPLSPLARLALAFEILKKMDTDYRARVVSTRENVALSLGQAEVHVGSVIDDLAGGGLIRGINGGLKEGYVPAAPLGQIKAFEIGDLILGGFSGEQAPDNPAVRAREAMHRSLNGEMMIGSQPAEGVQCHDGVDGQRESDVT
jgi:membrane protein